MNSRLNTLLDWMEARQESIVGDIIDLASIDSQSGDVQGITETVESINRNFHGIVDSSRQFITDSGPVLVCEMEGSGKPLLILAHSDTVWPAEGSGKPPLGIEGQILRGPGVLDMKGSIVMIRYALLAIKELDFQLNTPVKFIVTPDEEIGSPNSKTLVTEIAQDACAAFVPEPAQYTESLYGAIKRSRKGSSKYTITVTGRAAHAGTNPQDGINAIYQIAPLIDQISLLDDHHAGIYCNVTTIDGGTASNAIPESVKVSVDVRFSSMEAGSKIDSSIHSLRAEHDEARVEVVGGICRPPMEYSSDIEALVRLYQQIASELDIGVTAMDTGGGSDGNLTAAAGVPTLDGIGLDGFGAHTVDEHVKLDSLPQRFAMFAELLLRFGE